MKGRRGRRFQWSTIIVAVVVCASVLMGVPEALSAGQYQCDECFFFDLPFECGPERYTRYDIGVLDEYLIHFSQRPRHVSYSSPGIEQFPLVMQGDRQFPFRDELLDLQRKMTGVGMDARSSFPEKFRHRNGEYRFSRDGKKGLGDVR